MTNRLKASNSTRKYAITLACVATCLLSACSGMQLFPAADGSTQTSVREQATRALEIPPDLSQPQGSNLYQLPELCAADANTAATPANPVPAKTQVEKLTELKALRDKGLLSDDEYQKKRESVLNSL